MANKTMHTERHWMDEAGEAGHHARPLHEPERRSPIRRVGLERVAAAGQ